MASLSGGAGGGGPRAAEDALLINSGVLSLYCCANQAQMWTPQLQKIIRAVLTADASREGGRGLTSWRGGAGGGELGGGTILIVPDGDPTQICTRVKVNQA